MHCELEFLLYYMLCSLSFARPRCPSYSVPDRSSFVTYNLVKETENAMAQLKTLLESFFHLTLSFDGWSSRRSDEIYTVHVSTPTRMSYLVAGIILTGLSTTGEVIFDNLKKVRFLSYPQLECTSNVLVASSLRRGAVFDDCFRHHRQRQKVPGSCLRHLSVDLKLPGSLSPAQFACEGHNGRFEEVSEDSRICRSIDFLLYLSDEN